MRRDPYLVSTEQHDALTGLHVHTDICRCGATHTETATTWETAHKALLAWRRAHDCTERKTR
jgi:hypothetical protein